MSSSDKEGKKEGDEVDLQGARQAIRLVAKKSESETVLTTTRTKHTMSPNTKAVEKALQAESKSAAASATRETSANHPNR